MLAAAEALEFERAAALRDRISKSCKVRWARKSAKSMPAAVATKGPADAGVRATADVATPPTERVDLSH